MIPLRCTAFAIKDGFCQLYLLEKEKYRDLDVTSTDNIFVNYKVEKCEHKPNTITT